MITVYSDLSCWIKPYRDDNYDALKRFLENTSSFTLTELHLRNSQCISIILEPKFIFVALYCCGHLDSKINETYNVCYICKKE